MRNTSIGGYRGGGVWKDPCNGGPAGGGASGRCSGTGAVGGYIGGAIGGNAGGTGAPCPYQGSASPPAEGGKLPGSEVHGVMGGLHSLVPRPG